MPQFEWRIREIGRYNTYSDQGIVEADDITSAKHLITKTTKTAHWGC